MKGKTRNGPGRIVALLAWLALSSPLAHAQCTVDVIHRSGFDNAGLELVLDGQLAGIASASIELRVGDSVLATTQAQDGGFSLQVPVLAPDAMIELRARGLAAQGEEVVELATYLGTVGHLYDRSRQDGHVRIAELPALAVSPRNTATYALLRLAYPGDPVADECELATRIGTLDQGDVLTAAAVTKIVIADGGFASSIRAGSAPHGSPPATTLELLLDPVAFAQEVAAIEAADPARIEALEAVLGESFCEYFDPEAILVSLSRARGEQLNTGWGELYERTDATNGTHTNPYGPDDYTWQCAGDVMEISFAGERVSLTYPVRVVGGVPQQVTAELRTRRARLTRIDSDEDIVTLAAWDDSLMSFPFHPALQSETVLGEAPAALIRESTGTPYDAATVSGAYVLPSSGLTGDRSANTVWLEPDHTGMDLDGGSAPITWSVNAAGELLLTFTQRTVRIIPLRDEAPTVTDVVALTEFPDGTRAIAHQFAMRSTDESWWSGAAVQGDYLQNAGRVGGDNTFRIEVRPDTSAPTFQYFFAGEYAGQEFALAVMYWSHDVFERRLALRRCIGTDGNGDTIERVIVDREPASGECDQFYRRRTLFLATRHGDDLYFREDNQDWYSDPTAGGPPSYEHSRPILYRKSPLPAGALPLQVRAATESWSSPAARWMRR